MLLLATSGGGSLAPMLRATPSAPKNLSRPAGVALGFAAASCAPRPRTLNKGRTFCLLHSASPEASSGEGAPDDILEQILDSAEDVDPASLRLADDALREAEASRSKNIKPGLGRAIRSSLPCVAVCGIGEPPQEGGSSGSNASVGYQLMQRLTEEASSQDAPVWVDLTIAARRRFEEVDRLLVRCRAAVICPNLEVDDRRRLEEIRQGLKTIVTCFPPLLSRVVLLSQMGAQSSKGSFNVGSFFGVDARKGTFAGLEAVLTSESRKRPGRSPLRVVVVRAGQPCTSSLTEVRCSTDDLPGCTSVHTASEAMLQALALSVDIGFSVVEDQLPQGSRSYKVPIWEELLLPFVGPEIWQHEVPDARRAILFIQQWAGVFFGSDEEGSVMRFGLKTPVEQCLTPSGCIFKFRPFDTPSGRVFEDLDQGGLEFIVEEPRQGSPRLRVRRAAYGFKVVIKDNSEQALLRQFKQDWQQSLRPSPTWWPKF